MCATRKDGAILGFQCSPDRYSTSNIIVSLCRKTEQQLHSTDSTERTTSTAAAPRAALPGETTGRGSLGHPGKAAALPRPRKPENHAATKAKQTLSNFFLGKKNSNFVNFFVGLFFFFYDYAAVSLLLFFGRKTEATDYSRSVSQRTVNTGGASNTFANVLKMNKRFLKACIAEV